MAPSNEGIGTEKLGRTINLATPAASFACGGCLLPTKRDHHLAGFLDLFFSSFFLFSSFHFLSPPLSQVSGASDNRALRVRVCVVKFAGTKQASSLPVVGSPRRGNRYKRATGKRHSAPQPLGEC